VVSGKILLGQLTFAETRQQPLPLFSSLLNKVSVSPYEGTRPSDTGPKARIL
jgi:hypothetical protein